MEIKETLAWLSAFLTFTLLVKFLVLPRLQKTESDVENLKENGHEMDLAIKGIGKDVEFIGKNTDAMGKEMKSLKTDIYKKLDEKLDSHTLKFGEFVNRVVEAVKEK